MRRALLIGAGLILIQGLAGLVYFAMERSRQSPAGPLRYERLSGEELAPELELERDGVTTRLSERRGKLVLLHFWASWCAPCREELPALLSLSQELAQGGRFELIAVTAEEDHEAVRRFFEGEIPPEVYWDTAGEGQKRYEVSALPDTYLLGADGTLLLRFGGPRDWQAPSARKLLERELERRR